MIRRVLALLFLPAAVAAVVACGDDAPSAGVDAGAPGIDATIGGVDATEEEAAMAEASCGVDVGPFDDAEVTLGLHLVGTRKCENCHGSTLSGNNDGVPSPTTEGGLAYPPNLTSDPTTGLGCWTDPQIVTAILDGLDNQGNPLCPPMPRFGHLGDGGLDAAQAQAIVDYLRSLPSASNLVPATPGCVLPEGGSDAPPDGGTDAAPDSAVDASAGEGGSVEGGD